MNQITPITHAVRYPVTTSTIVLAIIATSLWWSGCDIRILQTKFEVRDGQVWRFITAALPHVNIIHLGFNVYWVWTLGTIVEREYRSLRALALYAFLAAASSAMEYAFLSGGVGLSGVGYGLFGFLWTLSRFHPRYRNALSSKVTQLFVAWFFTCIFLTYARVFSIANIAHLVGAISGGLAGMIAVPGIHRKIWATASGSLLLVSLILAIFARPLVNFSKDSTEEAYAGYIALTKDQNTRARQLLSDAVKINPRDSAVWFNLGIACQRLDRDAEAAIAYGKAHQLNPKDVQYKEMSDAFPLTK